jgi:hypothetical protein
MMESIHKVMMEAMMGVGTGARKRDMMNDYDGLEQINLSNYLLKYYFSGYQNFHQKT